MYITCKDIFIKDYIIKVAGSHRKSGKGGGKEGGKVVGLSEIIFNLERSGGGYYTQG